MYLSTSTSTKYPKNYYKLLIGNRILAFDWCHFWWPWMIFEGHFTLLGPICRTLYRIRPQELKLLIRNETSAFGWFDCRWPWRYFNVIKLFHIKFLVNGALYGKSDYRILIGNHTLAFDWCHFWWPWSTFEGHFSLAYNDESQSVFLLSCVADDCYRRLMPVTHSQDSCTRNLCKFLVQVSWLCVIGIIRTNEYEHDYTVCSVRNVCNVTVTSRRSMDTEPNDVLEYLFAHPEIAERQPAQQHFGKWLILYAIVVINVYKRFFIFL